MSKIIYGHIASGWFFAQQGQDRVSIRFEGDIIRNGTLYAETKARAFAALAVAKIARQQARRPPAPDSRPRKCHAKPRGSRMRCHVCGISWKINDPEYPDCKGDE
jgi:hypothetical protein